ncbi:MAG: glycosyltransferase family 4 protein [bacterium]|nr:glycosyltransferase family 4 protein [bacterium]
MAKVLVCGLCPLPFENTLRSFGPGIRSWQFAHSLAAAGHQVYLVAMKIPDTYEDFEAVATESCEGVRVERLDHQVYHQPEEIEARIAEFRPDAVVGATIYGSWVLARTRPRVPFWADQFGQVMAEAQAKARLERENWPLAHFWSMLEPVLRTADRFSVVSHRQRYALIGELGVMGRLTYETCGYEFTSVIPCALVPRPATPIRSVLRGTAIPDDAFIVLWSGGYNVWSDVETLRQALEMAMEEDSRIHFVSTGGEIGGHDETTYRDFQTRVAQSRFRRRFHLRGWVRAELIPSYEAEADLGVLTENPMYEGLLGSKNRIVQWMGAGLPVAYNTWGDIGDLLHDHQLGLTFEPGDSEALARRIVWASAHRDELARIAERARQYAHDELSFAATTREIVAWTADPVPAPDAALCRTISGPADFALQEASPHSEPVSFRTRLREVLPSWMVRILSKAKHLVLRD